MQTYNRQYDIWKEISDLQMASFSKVLVLMSIVGYLWLCWVSWPAGRQFPLTAWASSLVLLISAFTSFLVRKRFVNLSYMLAISGCFISIAYAVLTFQTPSAMYLFMVIVIIASVVYDWYWILLWYGITLISGLILPFNQPGMNWITWAGILTLLTILLIISRSSFYTALTWAFNGYQEAAQRQQQARERQAELKQVLKTLDTTTYNLERTNYLLNIAQQQSEEARMLKQQFAQNISHELRTPLNLIVGFTEMMVQSPEYYGQPLPNAYLQDLTTVYRNASHLQDLVNDVLDLARIESAQLNLAPEPTEITQLILDTANTVHNLVEARGLDLITDIEPNLPILEVDPVRIRQIMFNLINNAARFTVSGSVTIRVHQNDEHIIFSVTDTGVGIPQAEINRVFEAFHQIDGTTGRKHEGAGLGLTISKHFVELHGGRIWVESVEGEGSTFFFTLPITTTVDPYQTHTVHATRAGSRNKERLLLAVTRSPAAATLLNRYLKQCRTVIVTDFEQVATAARKLLPQVVLIDTSSFKQVMTAVDLEQLAEQWNLRKTSLIAGPLPGEERLRQKSAANGYLLKPISRENLWDMLRQFEATIDKILLVDDDRDFVRLMKRLLDNPLRRYRVYSAYTGREALRLAQQFKPDLILLDFRLPDIDGPEVLAELRKVPGFAHTPVVIVSGQDELDTMAMLYGPVIITKQEGYLPVDIIQTVQSVLDISTASHARMEAAPPLHVV